MTTCLKGHSRSTSVPPNCHKLIDDQGPDIINQYLLSATDLVRAVNLSSQKLLTEISECADRQQRIDEIVLCRPSQQQAGATLLIITRKTDESIVIDGRITITILNVGNSIRVGIDAPHEITVHREEVHKRIVGQMHDQVPLIGE